MRRLPLFGLLALLIVPFYFGGCGVALGPGYSIQKQSIELRYVASPEPHLSVHGVYELLNSGNQPLNSIRLLVPGVESFRRSETSAKWNDRLVVLKTVSSATPADRGDTIEVILTEPWRVKQKRTLTLDYDLSTGFHLGSYLAVSPDTFFAFSDSWNPELLPPKHLFGTGGTPPKKWTLFVCVPSGFLAHAAGTPGKRGSEKDKWVYSFLQQPGDFAPFAAGGRYVEKEITANGQRVLFWTLQPVDSSAAQRIANSVEARAHHYESEYGALPKGRSPIRLVECKIPTGNFGCGALPETVFIKQAWVARGLADQELLDDLNFELAYTWFGGVSRVRFDESPLPMDALAPYAGWEAQTREEGEEARSAKIRSLLSDFDKRSGDCKEKIVLPLAAGQERCVYSPAWTKSALFFFALEDRIGRTQFHQSLKSLIQDRRGRDFSLEDLISAMESETHQLQGQFVRQWLKHPGIPDDFRARYSMAASPATSSELNLPKESLP